MPNELVVIGVVVLLGSWLLLGEKKSVKEKLAIIFSIFFIYVAFRFLSGASMADVLSPITQSFK